MSDVARVRSVSVCVDWFEDKDSAERNAIDESYHVVLEDECIEWRRHDGTVIFSGTKEMMRKLCRVTDELCDTDFGGWYDV